MVDSSSFFPAGHTCSECDCQLSQDRHPCTQIPATLLLLPEGRTDVRLHTLWCPIIFMQMRLKSGEIGGHPSLLVLISNKCNNVYIIHECPSCVTIHSNLEHEAGVIFNSRVSRTKSLQISCSLQYEVEGRHSGEFPSRQSPFKSLILRRRTHRRAIRLLIS